MRATFDMKQFAKPYCFLRHEATGKYITVDTSHSVSQYQKVFALQFEKVDNHLNNINAQFSGLPMQAASGKDAPVYDFLTHQLTGLFVTVRATWYPYELNLYANMVSPVSKFNFRMIDDSQQLGYLTIRTDVGSGSILDNAEYVAAMADSRILDSTAPDFDQKVAALEGRGEVVPFAVGFNQNKESSHRFTLITGANPEQLFIPSYGLLKVVGDGGWYVVIDPSTLQLRMVKERPTALDAFALTSNRCIQHRFTFQCLKANTQGPTLLLDTQPQADCQWQ
jgi:hypothetical protein